LVEYRHRRNSRISGSTQIILENEPMPIRQIIIPVGPSIAYVPLTKGQFALIDREDAELVSGHSWCAFWDKTTQSFYARDSSDLIGMHRIISKCPDDMEADHKNHRTLDNRACNLRPATKSQNQHNCRLRKDSTTGFKGVCARSNGRYGAYLYEKGVFVHLGYFSCPEEAARKYDVEALARRGQFAKLNFPEVCHL
jgi:hypothetical protein